MRAPLARGVFVAAALLAAVLVATASRYGYHRDELYFILIGRHPAAGYVDQPPLVPLLAAAMDRIGNGSLVVLRLPSALALGAVVVLTGMTARELGAQRRGQLLAAAAIAVSAYPVAVGHLLSTSTFDLLSWTALSWLLVRALRDGGRAWWWVGLAAGLALEVKPLVLLLLGSVAVCLLRHRALRDPHLWGAALLAMLLWAPNLWWQATHGLPVVEMSRALSGGGSATSEPRALIVPFQLVLALPVWLVGWWHLARSPGTARLRPLAWGYVVALVVVLLSGGKPYYLAGFYPLLLAAAAVPVECWLARRPGPRLRTAATVLAVWGAVSAMLFLPLLPASVLHATPVPAVNADAEETVGWPALAATLSGAVQAAGPGTVVLTGNYGEAGAVARFAPAVPVYSGHNSLHDLGPPPATTTTAVTIGIDRADLDRWFTRCEQVAVIDNGLDLDSEEQGEPVLRCSAPRQPWSVLWPQMAHLG